MTYEEGKDLLAISLVAVKYRVARVGGALLCTRLGFHVGQVERQKHQWRTELAQMFLAHHKNIKHETKSKLTLPARVEMTELK